MGVVRLLRLSVCLAAVGSFYLDQLLGDFPTSDVCGTLFIASIAGLAFIEGLRKASPRPKLSGARAIGALLLALAIFGISISTMRGLLLDGMAIKDWALFTLFAGVPVLLLFVQRAPLIEMLGRTCVVFAVIDLAANLLAVTGLITLKVYGGRISGFEQVTRYPGVAGNTLAAGLVAFIAVVYLAVQFRDERRRGRVIIFGALAAGIGFNLLLIDARRYLAMAVVGSFLVLVARRPNRLPLPISTIALASALIGLTFAAGYGDGGNQLRARLYTAGWLRAMEHPFFGDGMKWWDSRKSTATFWDLSQHGVTESQLLDMMIAYGCVTVVLFAGAALVTLSARRSQNSVPLVILAMMTAELAFGGALGGFLGSLAFYTSMIYCLNDDVLQVVPAPQRMKGGSSMRSLSLT